MPKKGPILSDSSYEWPIKAFDEKNIGIGEKNFDFTKPCPVFCGNAEGIMNSLNFFVLLKSKYNVTRPYYA